MSYAAAIDALNAMAPELYTRPGVPRRKFSLAEIGVLLHHLNDPHHRFQSILIAGTNIVDPVISIITDISLDHMEWLGYTIAAITREKAGILRPRGVLVTLPQHPEANQALGEVAMELDVRGVSATRYTPTIGTGASAAYAAEVMGTEIEVNS